MTHRSPRHHRPSFRNLLVALVLVSSGIIAPAAHGAPLAMTRSELASAIKSTPQLLFVEMSASWCVNCRTVEHDLQMLAARHGDAIRIATLDVGRYSSAFSRYDLRVVPTVLVFRDGLEVDRHVGVPNPTWLADAVSRHQTTVVAAAEAPSPAAAPTATSPIAARGKK